MDQYTIGIWVAAILTLSIYSFLYKDNPFYKVAEHLVVGVSVGYGFVLTIKQVFIPFVWIPISGALGQLFGEGNFTYELTYIFPAMIGMLYLFRFSRTRSWLSRYPIAFSMGWSSGVAIPLTIKTNWFVQIRSTMLPLTQGLEGWGDGFLGIASAALLFLGVLTVLIFFYFSKPHKGVLGVSAKVGMWFLMLSFGASFGYTVMARISLLIGRMIFIFGDWLGIVY